MSEVRAKTEISEWIVRAALEGASEIDMLAGAAKADSKKRSRAPTTRPTTTGCEARSSP